MVLAYNSPVFGLNAACGQFLPPRTLGHISIASPARSFFASSDSTGRPVAMSTCVAHVRARFGGISLPRMVENAQKSVAVHLHRDFAQLPVDLDVGE